MLLDPSGHISVKDDTKDSKAVIPDDSVRSLVTLLFFVQLVYAVSSLNKVKPW